MLWPRLAPDDVSVYVCVGRRGEGGGTNQPKPLRGISRPCQRVTWVMSDAFFFPSASWESVSSTTHTHTQKVLACVCVQGCVAFENTSHWPRLLAAAAAGEGVLQWGQSIDTTKVPIKNLLTVLLVPNSFLRCGAYEESVMRYTYINITNELVIHKYYEGFAVKIYIPWRRLNEKLMCKIHRNLCVINNDAAA